MIKGILIALGFLELVGVAALHVYPEARGETIGFMVGVLVIGFVIVKPPRC